MGKELIIDQDPKSPIAEVFRTLRTNLQFMTSSQGFKTLLVTSSVPGEGKSWVSANLALAFTQEGKKVAVIDADMRKGRLHTIFGMEKSPGLSNFLSGVSNIENKDDVFNYIKKIEVGDLYVMPAGDVPPNPSELLVTENLEKLISVLKREFDVVIFDGTPCLLVTDSIILSRSLDATLLVTAYKSTKMGELEKIKKMIENVGGKIAGIVINKMPVKAKKYEDNYYYGAHEEKEKQKEQTKEDTTNEKNVGATSSRPEDQEDTTNEKDVEVDALPTKKKKKGKTND